MNVFTRIFTSRKVWVALSAVVLCMLTIFGADPEKWTPLITAIVTLAGVVIASIGLEDASAKFGAGEQAAGDAAPKPPPTIHTLAELRDVIQQMSDRQKQADSKPSDSSASGPGPAATMKSIALWLLPAGLLLILGCAASPTARWAQARDTLTVAERSILTLHAADVLDDADLVALDASVKAVRSALKSAEQRLPAGGEAFEFYLDLAEGILDKLTDPKLTGVQIAPSIQPIGGTNGTGGDPGGDSHRPRPDRLGDPASFAASTEWRVHRRAAYAGRPRSGDR